MLERASDSDLAWGVGLLASLKGPEVARVRLDALRDAAVVARSRSPTTT
jgi:hypothetical protein